MHSICNLRVSNLATGLRKLQTSLRPISLHFPNYYHHRWHSSVNQVSPRKGKVQNSPTIPPPSLFENIQAHWTSPNPPNHAIPTTRAWTRKECDFFKLHYCSVTDLSLWNTYFCESAPLTTSAEHISKFILGSLYAGGEYKALYDMLKIINCPHQYTTEKITDNLVLYLLNACNPDNKLVPKYNSGQFEIKVGKESFGSSPDAIVLADEQRHIGPLFVVVVDKPASDYGDQSYDDNDGVTKIPRDATTNECQIPGEMLAAAMQNYMFSGNPQTIFAMHYVGFSMRFYRADFPQHYLKSVQQGEPADDITIFRSGNPDKCSPRLDIVGGEVIQWICDIMAACTQMTESAMEKTVSPITKERLPKLYPMEKLQSLQN